MIFEIFSEYIWYIHEFLSDFSDISVYQTDYNHITVCLVLRFYFIREPLWLMCVLVGNLFDTLANCELYYLRKPYVPCQFHMLNKPES